MRSLAFIFSCVAFITFAGCGGAGNSVLPPSGHLLSRGGARAAAGSTLQTSYTAFVAADNPIAYYRLNDTTATLADSGANHLNGVYGTHVTHSGPALTSASGAQSSIFPGAPAGTDVTGYAGAVATNALFAAAATQLTVEAWISPATLNATNHYVPIVSYGREVQGQAWVLQESPQSALNFWMKTRGGSAPDFSVTSHTLLTPGAVYHVVASYNGATANIYINGTLETSVSASGSIDYSALQPQWGLGIGAGLGGSEPAIDGMLSDVAVYGSALAAADIANHYAVGRISEGMGAPTPTPAPLPATQAYGALVAAGNPLAFYQLADTTATLLDSGPNKLNGVYGAAVSHTGAPLTSSGTASATFPGAPVGSNVAANTASVPANAIFGGATTGVTVEAWINLANFNTTNNYVPIVSYGREVVGSAWSLLLSPQNAPSFFFKVIGGAGSYMLQAPILNPGQVYQLVATYDGANAKIYVNGVLAISQPASGTIDYSGLQSFWGLTVGGAAGGSLPIFNGSINDVSVYPTALAPSAVLQHYVVGHAVQAFNEKPTSSNVFVDSIGVVTHLRTTNGPYTDNWPAFVSLLEGSGIRHIGDSLIATPSWYPQHVSQLAAAGIRASLLVGLGTSTQEINATLPLFRNAIEAVQGPNEPDISGDPNWVADTRAFQQTLWTLIKGNSATKNLTVIGPSTISVTDQSALGNISAYMDQGSMHDYFDGFNPGTIGWGGISPYGIYGSIAYNIGVSAITSGTKPVMSTESGFSSDLTNSGGVDSRTLARYAPRLYLEHFLHGVPRSTIYEFYDEAGGRSFAEFGLVSGNNTPKTSYYAIQSLIHALNDPGTSFSTVPLHYTLTGNLDNVHHLLLQKRDGTYELVIWVEAQGFDPNSKVDMTIAPQTVTLQTGYLPAAANISVIGDSGTLTTSSLAFPSGAATFAIDDHVTIVSFK